jgi:hypothetical protein
MRKWDDTTTNLIDEIGPLYSHIAYFVCLDILDPRARILETVNSFTQASHGEFTNWHVGSYSGLSVVRLQLHVEFH